MSAEAQGNNLLKYYCVGVVQGQKYCQEPITHIDEKGFIYCAQHGKWRKESGRRCRKMTSKELKFIHAGKPLEKY